MAKLTAVLLAIFLAFFCMPFVSQASEALIENGSFESNILAWSHGSLTDNEPRFGVRCLSFSNPTTAETGFIHSNTYFSTIFLNANSVYSLKFYVRAESDLSSTLVPEGSINLSNNTGELTMRVSSVTDTWQPVAVCFTADNTGTFSFSFAVEHPDAHALIYIDEIELTPMDFTPVGLAILGRRNITIPEIGETTASYTAVVVDDAGNYVINRNASISVMHSLPQDVSFNESKGLLKVGANAPVDSIVTLLCTPFAESASFVPVSISIRLSRNIIINGEMDDISVYNGWDTELADFVIEQESSDSIYAKISCSSLEQDKYFGTIVPSHASFLQESTMYVFHGKVKADFSESEEKTKVEILPPDHNNVIHIQMSNLKRDWTDVIATFEVPSYGIYSFQFDFLTTEKQFVYFDSVVVQPEIPSPTFLYFDITNHISIPDSGATHYPVSYVIFDQNEQIIQQPVLFSVHPENSGVSVLNNMLTVLSSATPQTYSITAYVDEYPAVKNTKTLHVSNSSVWDGNFEESITQNAWATALPSTLSIVEEENGVMPTDGAHLARLDMNGSVSALMSDSICRFDAGGNYVFEAELGSIASDVQTIVTVMVDDVFSNSFEDNLVIGQFVLSGNMDKVQKLFTPSTSTTGRLLIAFNTPEHYTQQVILLDAVSITRANVSASSVSIGGLPYLDRIIAGKYRFSSNFSAVDSSTYRWLFSSTPNGIYMPIEGQTTSTLSITSEMIGKYVKFEVTPCSLSGPVVGASVASAPILIGEPIPSDTPSYDNELLEQQPTQDETDNCPEEIAQTSRGQLDVLDIRRFPVSQEHSFFDTTQHWALEEISLLTAAGIVQGRGLGLFEPEAYITRAEFSAILARAFGLAPIYYEGQFDDVKAHSWYAGAVAVVTKHGISQGTSQTMFSPELPIQREEMAAMIMRAYKKTGMQTNGTDLGYTDASQISSWAVSEVGEANALGLFSGLPDGSFEPKRNATRAEATVTIKRLISILLKQD